MLLSPRRSSTPADLIRLLAVWLAVVLLMQGFAAVHARVAGPAHQHRSAGAANLLAHRHHHDEVQRHHHAAADASVVSQADTAARDQALEQALDEAAAALAAAFLLLATAQPVRMAGGSGRGRVWRSALAWACSTRHFKPLLKPPQRG